MKKYLLAALLAGVATGAFAADLPTHKAPPMMQPVYAPPAFSWTGFYIGVNGGYGYGGLSDTNFGNASGGVVGGTAGYNYQIGQFVGGVEGDLDWTGMSKSNAYVNGVAPLAAGTNKFSTDEMATARLRAGFAVDRALFFVTGGWAGIQTNASFTDINNGITGSQSVWRNGAVIGGGIEYAFTNNISAKGEYLYAPMASQTYFAGTPDAENNKLAVSLFRVGVNYKF